MSEIVLPEFEIFNSGKVEQTPFQLGDLVQMRAKHLKMVRFRHYIKEDIGIVIDIKRTRGTWLIDVCWQNFKSQKGSSITSLKYIRLKKVKVKKNV